MYLCYDIKGIQQFIFSVPRLRYMIGGSGQISQFDERWREPGQIPEGIHCVFSGGGRGVFECCRDDLVEPFRKQLIDAAHQVGLDIRIGKDQDFSIAMQRADELYPYLPAPREMAGFPCSESGLYPVKRTSNLARNNRRIAVHNIIFERAKVSRRDQLGEDLINRIRVGREENLLPRELREDYSIEFIRNVSPELVLPKDADDDQVEEDAISEDQEVACKGQASLGNRNRWAIIAMDGNSIGRHFKYVMECAAQAPHALEVTSKTLQSITQRAFDDAAVKVISDWFQQFDGDIEDCCYFSSERQERRLLVPIRPVLIGGDDLIVLCHCAHAITFVETMVNRFEAYSREAGNDLHNRPEFGVNPWALNGGALTISAGVLFAKTSLPLHTAIPYAESLLASAKGGLRQFELDAKPIPSAVDWEVITDSVIDTPARRRQATLKFLDEDLGKLLFLTRKPYLVGDVAETEQGANPNHPRLSELQAKYLDIFPSFPNSFLAQLQRVMRQPWSERAEFLISCKKSGRYRELAESLELTTEGQPSDSNSDWLPAKRWAETDATEMPLEVGVLDAIELVGEAKRTKQETV